MLYNDQAEDFDKRAGIPPEAIESIVEALARVADFAPDRTVLEIGAGTGLLSLPILDHSVRYIGFDRSPEMLRVFRGKVERTGRWAELHVADGNGRWPAEEADIDVVFSARAMHHLQPDHVIAEVLRVVPPGEGILVLGQIRRPHDSVKSVMRNRMRSMLREEGLQGLSGGRYVATLFDTMKELGAEPVEPVVAARWSRLHSPNDSIAYWAEKRGLAGLDIEDDFKKRLLEELRRWASERFGDPDAALEQQESFELSALNLRNVRRNR